MQTTLKNRSIFCADNIDVLRGINTESVDLIYLDPPFNKNKVFTSPLGSQAEGASFRDIFRKEDVKNVQLKFIAKKYPKVARFIDSTDGLGKTYNKYYLIYMAVRLVELYRILKPTGSLYLHCDPTMNSYLRLLLDGIFGEDNFINEITWQRALQHNLATRRFDVITDTLLLYSKHDTYRFNHADVALSKKELSEKFPHIEKETGRQFMHRATEEYKNISSKGEIRVIQGKKVVSNIGWRWTQETFDERLKENPHIIYWTKNNRPRYKIYADEYLGRKMSNLWTDIPGLASGSKERVGYPTQKPLALLERIIQTSSNEGDVVLDPFCGCATACVAAERLGRQWIGIDVSAKAYELVQYRLKKEVVRTDEIFKKKVFFREGNEAYVQRTDLKADPRPKKEIKKSLYGDQGGYCNLCDHHFEPRHLEIDHLLPRAKGGGDNYANLQLLCSSCNRIKSARSMAEAQAIIQGKPD